MGDGELPLAPGGKAPLLPASGDGDEAERRGQLHVDAKLVLEPLDGPEERLCLRLQANVDVDGGGSPAEEDSGGAAGQVAERVDVGGTAESLQEAPDALGVG